MDRGENIRLVIWDLDDTFWKGVVSEGGISEYIQYNHDLVITLAQRGILSTICSKNDPEAIAEILEEKGISEYFVFPSVSWEPKGPRVRDLVESMQLRPASVMFIDDNPNNRAEVAAFAPEIQIEDESFIARIASDPRFLGKADPSLSRLRQYRLLERRKTEQSNSGLGNEAFLRACDIRVTIEYDIEAHVDRAIELINRTNQLNFTKRRLPEDREEARRVLLGDINHYDRQAGLIRVTDNYGDHGFVGFFLSGAGRTDVDQRAAARMLIHFAFSCRILGMGVERWVYEYLGRPYLRVTGEVLTDLSSETRVDWVRMAPASLATKVAADQIASEIRVLGGCEALALSFYLGAHAPSVKAYGNLHVNNRWVRINSAALMAAALRASRDEIAREARALGASAETMAPDFFAECPPGALFVFSGAMDSDRIAIRYRHRETGWEVSFDFSGIGACDLMAISEDDLRLLLAKDPRYVRECTDSVISAWRHLRSHYDSIYGFSQGEQVDAMRAVLESVPPGAKIVVMLDHVVKRRRDGALHESRDVARYNALISDLVEDYPYAAAMSYGAVIDDEDQLLGGANHYDRKVYLEAARRVIERAVDLPAR